MDSGGSPVANQGVHRPARSLGRSISAVLGVGLTVIGFSIPFIWSLKNPWLPAGFQSWRTTAYPFQLPLLLAGTLILFTAVLRYPPSARLTATIGALCVGCFATRHFIGGVATLGTLAAAVARHVEGEGDSRGTQSTLESRLRFGLTGVAVLPLIIVAFAVLLDVLRRSLTVLIIPETILIWPGYILTMIFNVVRPFLESPSVWTGFVSAALSLPYYYILFSPVLIRFRDIQAGKGMRARALFVALVVIHLFVGIVFALIAYSYARNPQGFWNGKF